MSDRTFDDGVDVGDRTLDIYTFVKAIALVMMGLMWAIALICL